MNPIELWSKIWLFIMGNPKDVDEMHWYNYLMLVLKFINVCLIFVFFHLRMWLFFAVCLISFLGDIWLYYSMKERYALYTEQKILEKELGIPKDWREP
jgi:hypothetical protein